MCLKVSNRSKMMKLINWKPLLLKDQKEQRAIKIRNLKFNPIDSNNKES